MLPDRACLGNLWRVGTWHERWKTLVHLSQHSSSPPVWQIAHKTSLESSSGAWCCSTCCCPPSERMWFAAALLLCSRGLLGGCEGLWGLSSVSPSSWILIWGWSSVLSGRLTLWLASAWNPKEREKQPMCIKWIQFWSVLPEFCPSRQFFYPIRGYYWHSRCPHFFKSLNREV